MLCGCLVLFAAWISPAWAVPNPPLGMVYVPEGYFEMGLSSSEAEDQKPMHFVYTSAFFIDKYEVSNAVYQKFMDATGYPKPKYWDDERFNQPNQPVVGVSWFDTMAYARWKGRRLPTEAEWEKAARGPNGFAYGFGNRPDGSKGNFGKGLRDGAVPVNSFSPNGYGLHQMNGNVWEWVGDWFGPYPEKRIKNPKGPDTGFQKIVRGGSWHNTAYYVHAGMRFKLDPNVSLNSVGFRCIYDLPGEKSNQ